MEPTPNEDNRSAEASVPNIPIPEPEPEVESEVSTQQDSSSQQISTPGTMANCTKTLIDYFSVNSTQRCTTENAISCLKQLIQHMSRYYYFHFLQLKLRKILFVLTDCPNEPRTEKYCSRTFLNISDILLDIPHNFNKDHMIKELISSTPYDRDSKTMDFQWRLQYAFEEAIFNSDSQLETFLQQFYSTIDLSQIWAQFVAFTDQCEKYFRNKYSIPEDLPQISSFCSRALYQRYMLTHPLFPKPIVNTQFLTQVSKLRKLTGSGFGAKEKFMPPGSFNTPVTLCPGLYRRSVSECNMLPFACIPDDLFRIICNMHDFLFEELVRIMYVRAHVRTSLADFRPTVQVGQEDILPIMILVLVLADIPNLPEIVDFFNEYSTHNQVNSKTGLYMANIAMAFGAIMNWEFE
ncbi:hypothetical protein GPJ56_004074 [Histomonas meleagridis]|uniref:uncharacterized protein n=1 Tax=Histomonas meleagridis TaxID=135588 RepID=UPI003559CC44|nr:hypothetical protein GPJ56_004074 [Histomonas meleagridis]KAH0799471.1 hypothetical protein GO595_007726 [Histomonas meleagridis]